MSSSLILVTKHKFNIPKWIELADYIPNLPQDFEGKGIYLSSLGQEKIVLNGWFSDYNCYCFEQVYIECFSEYSKVKKGNVEWHQSLEDFLPKLLDYFIDFLSELRQYGKVFLVEVWQSDKKEYMWDPKLTTDIIRTKSDLNFNVVTQTKLSLSELQKSKHLEFIRNNIVEIID